MPRPSIFSGNLEKASPWRSENNSGEGGNMALPLGSSGTPAASSPVSGNEKTLEAFAFLASFLLSRLLFKLIISLFKGSS